MTAIIIPVGEVASNPDLLDVATHVDHLIKFGKVFWNVNLPGTPEKEKTIRRAPWKYDEITQGYFLTNKTKKIPYEFEIELVKQIFELDLQNSGNKFNRYIPQCRQNIFNFSDDTFSDYCPNDYAFLIKAITPLNQIRNLNEFNRLDTGEPLKYLRNYSIVEDL